MTITVDHTSTSTTDTVRVAHLQVDVARRTRLTERLAMRIALVLLLWSTRPRTTDAVRLRRAAADEQRILREARWQRAIPHPHL